MSTHDDLRLQRYLRGLPQAEPPSSLGARILHRHAARRRLRRFLPPLAIAAALALALIAPRWLATPGEALPSPVAASADAAGLAELRAIDRQLQNAYLAKAPSASVDTLWQARSETESRLRQGQPAPRLLQL
jgi:hypothetical protein